ncbi:MAG: ribonuclease P protein component [Flavobacteriaceae bacterium]|nr:ribonuclease P protein component [Flavobacteriaceae bacterium]
MNTIQQKLLKARILSNKNEIDILFAKGKRKQKFPLAMVYYTTDNIGPSHKILFVTPKKIFPKAVKRNLIKRQLRELYRKNQDLFVNREGHILYIAIIALADFNKTKTDDLKLEYKNLITSIYENT